VSYLQGFRLKFCKRSVFPQWMTHYPSVCNSFIRSPYWSLKSVLNCTYMCNHWNSERHHYNAHSKCKLFPVRTQYFWPVIHHTCDKRFYDAEFAVDSKDLQREERHVNSVGRNSQPYIVNSNNKQRWRCCSCLSWLSIDFWRN